MKRTINHERLESNRQLMRLVSELITIREKSLGESIDLNGPEYKSFDAGLRLIADCFNYALDDVWEMAEYLDGSVPIDK